MVRLAKVLVHVFFPRADNRTATTTTVHTNRSGAVACFGFWSTGSRDTFLPGRAGAAAAGSYIRVICIPGAARAQAVTKLGTDAVQPRTAAHTDGDALSSTMNGAGPQFSSISVASVSPSQQKQVVIL